MRGKVCDMVQQIRVEKKTKTKEVALAYLGNDDENLEYNLRRVQDLPLAPMYDAPRFLHNQPIPLDTASGKRRR